MNPRITYLSLTTLLCTSALMASAYGQSAPPRAVPLSEADYRNVPRAVPLPDNYVPSAKPRPKPKAKPKSPKVQPVAHKPVGMGIAPVSPLPETASQINNQPTTETTSSANAGEGYGGSAYTPRSAGVMVTHAPASVGNRVALTFDDGPAGGLTSRVIDILDRYGAKGTFFIQGINVAGNEAVLRRMVQSGHEVGNHTWNHAYLSKVSREKAASQMTACNNAVERACGIRPVVMRPPGGHSNMALAQWTQQQFGMRTIMWSVDTNDWKKPGASVVAARAINGATSGSIILVHDIHASTVNAVEAIVQGLQRRGFELVTVSELFASNSTPGTTPVSAPGAPNALPIPASHPAGPPVPDPLKNILIEPPTPNAPQSNMTVSTHDPRSAGTQTAIKKASPNTQEPQAETPQQPETDANPAEGLPADEEPVLPPDEV